MGLKPKYMTYDEASSLAREVLRSQVSQSVDVSIKGQEDYWYMLVEGLTADDANSLINFFGKSILDSEINSIYAGKSSMFYTSEEECLKKILYPEGGVVKIFATSNGLFTITTSDSSIVMESTKSYLAHKEDTSWFALALADSIASLEVALLSPSNINIKSVLSALAKVNIVLYAIEDIYGIPDSAIINELRKYS